MSATEDPIVTRARAIMRDLADVCRKHGAVVEPRGFADDDCGWVELAPESVEVTEPGGFAWAFTARWYDPSERRVRISSDDPEEQAHLAEIARRDGLEEPK